MKSAPIISTIALLALSLFPIQALAGTYSGLWIGQIEVNQVNEVGSKTDAAVPTDAPNPFDMRILLHVDAADQASLLKEVTIMQKRYDVVQDDGTTQEMVRRALITDDALLADFEGVVRRDGNLVGIRLGSLAFDFDPGQTEFPLTGNLGPGQTVEGTLALSQDHPTNPFRHSYHPDHKTGRAVSRTFAFEFDAQQATDDPESGQFSLTGAFRETLTGLHKIPLNVKGTFSLQRVSLIDRLNDQG